MDSRYWYHSILFSSTAASVARALHGSVESLWSERRLGLASGVFRLLVLIIINVEEPIWSLSENLNTCVSLKDWCWSDLFNADLLLTRSDSYDIDWWFALKITVFRGLYLSNYSSTVHFYTDTLACGADEKKTALALHYIAECTLTGVSALEWLNKMLYSSLIVLSWSLITGRQRISAAWIMETEEPQVSPVRMTTIWITWYLAKDVIPGFLLCMICGHCPVAKALKWEIFEMIKWIAVVHCWKQFTHIFCSVSTT